MAPSSPMEKPASRLKGTTNYFLNAIFPHGRLALPGKGKAFKNKPFSSSSSSSIVSNNKSSEPTSPKVSCMGQIKHIKNADPCQAAPPFARRICMAIRRMFRSKVSPSLVQDVDEGCEGAAQPLPLGQMKWFGGRREALADIDRREVKKTDSGYTDNDGGEEEVVMIIPDYAVAEEVAVEPKKQVNLWKRRTFAPPIPLQLNT